MNDKIKAFVKIIEMISNNISNENLQSFSNLEQFVTENGLQVEDNLLKNIKRHEKFLKTTFKENYSEFFWKRNPFIWDLDDIP